MAQEPKKQQIRTCFFQAQVTEGSANIKFPCSFFLEWKTSHSKNITSSKNRRKAVAGKICFNQILQLNTKLIYDCNDKFYFKKQSAIMVNLISNSRPNEPKLVGRVLVDLDRVANGTSFQQFKTYSLQYCSVEGNLTLKVTLKEQKETTLSIKDLQKSEISQFQSALQDKKNLKDDTKSDYGSKSLLPAVSREKIISRITENRPDKLQIIRNERLKLQKQKQTKDNESKTQKIVSNQNQPLLQSKYTSKQLVKIQNQQKLQTNTQKYQLKIPVLSNDYHQFDSSKKASKNYQYSVKSQKGNTDRSVVIGHQIFSSTQKPLIVVKPIQISQNTQPNKLLENNQSLINKMQVELLSLKLQNQSLKITIEQQKQIIQQSQKQIAQKLDQIQQMRVLIFNKDEQLKKQSQVDYVGQIDSLTLALDSEKRKNQESAQNGQLLSRLQSEFNQLSKQHKQIQEENNFLKKQLSQKTNHIFQILRQNQQLTIKNKNIITNNSQSLNSKDQFNKMRSQIQIVQSKLSTEIQNHKNTQLELKQMRQWYKEIQEQVSKLELQKQSMILTIQQAKSKEDAYLSTIQALQQYKKNTAAKQLQDTQNKDESISSIEQQLSTVKNELQLREKQIQRYSKLQISLNEKLSQMQQRLEDLQLRYLQQTQELKLQKQKIQQLQQLIKDVKKNSSSNLTAIEAKDQQIQIYKTRSNELVHKLKDTEQLVYKLKKDLNQAELHRKQVQALFKQHQTKIRLLQQELTQEAQKNKSLQEQSKQTKGRFQREVLLHKQEELILKRTIEDQLIKNKQLSKLLNDAQSSFRNVQSKRIKELELTIQKFQQKQKQMKQNLNLLQYQSNTVADLLQEKQENEQKLKQAIFILQTQNTQLIAKLQEFENSCMLLNQRNQGLAAELELLSNYNSSDIDNNEMAEINKKLIEKNKELLELLEIKNNEIASKVKNQNQLKGLTAEQQLSNDRFQRQKAGLQQQIRHLTQINQKLYRQFQSLNVKIESQIIANQQKTEKISQYEAHIEQLHSKLTEQQLKSAQIQIQKKEQLQSLLQTINQKQFQLQYYITQINYLNNTIQNLNSEVGQKQVQIFEKDSKLQQLKRLKDQQAFQITLLTGQLQNLRNQTNKINQSPVSSGVKQISDSQNIHIAELEQKNALQFKQLLVQTDQIDKLRQAFDLQLNEIQKLKRQITHLQDLQKGYLNKIVELEEQSKWKQSQLNNIQIENNSNQLQLKNAKKELSQLRDQVRNHVEDYNNLRANNQKLIQRLQYLQQEKAKANKQNNSPILKITEVSPSPQKKLNLDISQILSQIKDIVNRRKEEAQLQNAFRLVIDNNARQEQQFQRWGRQRGFIQERAKLASKQIQKVKSAIMKTSNRNINQKTQLINLLKPAQKIVNQLIKLSQTLAEMDLQFDPQQQFDEELPEDHKQQNKNV